MKVAVIGRTEILYETLKLLLDNNYEIGLIITSKEAPEYTKSAFEFEQIAKKNKIKYIYTSRLDDYVRDIKDASCDIAVSLNYSSIISQKVIDLFPLGILNAHGGDLPKYRGNACQAWAILNGETKIGLCIHSMIGGEVDNGNIIDRKFLDIDINTKITYIYQWFAEVIPNMFLESINKLANNPLYVLESKNEDSSRAMRCYPRLPEDGKIDWRKTNLEILRLINATNKPYCGAYCEYDNNKFIIWDAELYNDDEKYLSECGQVCSIDQDGSIIVITGNGKLKINTIEYMGFVGSPWGKDKKHKKKVEVMNCFIEDFTENNYKELLKKIKNTTIFFDEYQKMNKYVILRHDVDFSMHRAFALSKIEYNLGLKATYFVQLGSLFYNLFEHEIRELVSNILGLGHQIGLHFDPTQYHISNISDLNQHLVFEKSILENLFQTTIKAFSFHNPSSDILKYDDMAYVDMINAYAKYFKEHVAYCSDSNGYWRYKRLDSFLSECHDRVQILTHPAWWQRKEMKPRDRILKCIKGRYDSTIKKYDQTLKDNGRINVK